MSGEAGHLILAPMRGVTTRAFREVFAQELSEAGFEEAFSPFIPVVSGFNPAKTAELLGREKIRLTVQFIGKDPALFGECLKRALDAGFETADLNAGCPYPMVRNKGRGSGLISHPDVLERMIETGCRIMGEGRFSVKTRLGVRDPDELEKIMPVFNRYPLRFLVLHARTAVQMYDGECDMERFSRIAELSRVPVVRNGDIRLEDRPADSMVMIGRSFLRRLGSREDSPELLSRYSDHLLSTGLSSNGVCGKLKELLGYWKDIGRWKRLWPVLKLARTPKEFSVVW